MTEKLERIEEQIKATEARRVEVTAEVQGLEGELATKRAEMASAISEKGPTTALEAEIASLDLRLGASRQAHDQDLPQTLRDLQLDRKLELQSIGRDQADRARGEILKLLAEIYGMLGAIAGRFSDLRAAEKEFKAGLRASDPRTAHEKSWKLGLLINSLEKQIPQLLPTFPREILRDGELPTAPGSRPAPRISDGQRGTVVDPKFSIRDFVAGRSARKSDH